MLTRKYLLEELGKCNSVCCGSIFELSYCLDLIKDDYVTITVRFCDGYWIIQTAHPEGEY